MHYINEDINAFYAPRLIRSGLCIQGVHCSHNFVVSGHREIFFEIFLMQTKFVL